MDDDVEVILTTTQEEKACHFTAIYDSDWHSAIKRSTDSGQFYSGCN